MKITDIPIYFVKKPNWPKIYVFRRDAEHDILSYEPDGESKFHVAFASGSLTGKNSRKLAKVAVQNLGSAIFESEYPGMFLKMIKHRAETINIQRPDNSYAVQWKRYEFLTNAALASPKPVTRV